MSAVGQPMPDDMPEERSQADIERLRSALIGIIQKLEAEANKRVTERAPIEKRWLEDLQQYYGQYDDATLSRLAGAKKSMLFMNKTRPKTNSCDARLSDMLFPTDDKNWGIFPTPVPELTQGAKMVIQRAHGMAAQATQAALAGDVQGEQAAVTAGNEAAQLAADASKEAKEASSRASAMEAEMDDQLTECIYASACRDVIRDACMVGTGVLEGPIASTKPVQRWTRKTGPDGNAVQVLANEPNPKPAYYRVDYWDFFPPMTARTIEDCDSFFIRNLTSKKQLRALAKQPGFDKDAVRRLLTEGPKSTNPEYLANLRALSGAQTSTSVLTDNYHVWRYIGPLTGQELSDLTIAFDREDMTAGMEIDPLEEVQVILWFCQNEVLKFGIHPLDSGEPLFSVFNLDRDPSNIFGYGIPYQMRDSQSALNAAWRTMMDNAGLSSGPQIEVDTSVIEPVEGGNWNLESRKVWQRLATAPVGKPGIICHDIPSHQPELANIIELAGAFIDEETSMPQIAQGETGQMPIQTAHGMSLLMNAANIVVRRVVRNFDDQLTVPSIRRLYHWNMQFSDKEYIKGDYEVDARGSSVLLVREIQATNLFNLLRAFGPDPIFGPYIKKRKAFEAYVKSNMISVSEVVNTDEDMAEEAKGKAPQPTPQEIDAQTKLQLAQLDHKNRMEQLGVEREIRLTEFASKMNMTLDQLKAKMADSHATRESKERLFAAEAALTPDPRNAA
jgi:hypothetical protein